MLSGENGDPPEWRIAVFEEGNKNAPLFATIETDIVGYATIHMEAGKWYQIGNPFVRLDESVQETPLHDFLVGKFQEGDTVSIFDSATSSYTIYTWSSRANGEGWYKGFEPFRTNATVTPGKAVFIHKTKGESDITFSGRVSKDSIVEIGTEAGNTWDQVVCMYPKKMKLNDIEWDGMDVGDTVSIFSPEDDSYSIYTWRNGASGTGWYRGFEPTFPEEELPVAQAFFVYKKNGVGSISAK